MMAQKSDEVRKYIAPSGTGWKARTSNNYVTVDYKSLRDIYDKESQHGIDPLDGES